MNQPGQSSPRSAEPTSFELAVPGAARGEFKVYRFNRAARTLSLVRTVSASDSLTTMQHFIPYAGGSIVVNKKDDGSNITPGTPPTPPPTPPGGDDGFVLPIGELTLAQTLLTQQGHVAGGQILVSTRTA